MGYRGAGIGALALAAAMALGGCSANAPKKPTEYGPELRPDAGPPEVKFNFPEGGLLRDGSIVASGDCSYDQELMYLVGVESDDAAPAVLFTYDPKTAKLKRIAELDGCPDANPTTNTWPLAVTVDREGLLWVLFVEGYGDPASSRGRIFQVDNEIGECTDTMITFKARPGSWIQGGMAFVSKAADASDEKLYLGGVFDASGSPPRLLSLDPRTLAITPIGPFDGMPSTFWPTKLAGTSDGQLFAIAGDTYTEVSTTSFKTTGPRSLGLPTDHFPGSALAYYGEDFWMFETVGKPSARTTKVYKRDLALDVTAEQTEIWTHVTAAAVTTCGPTVKR